MPDNHAPTESDTRSASLDTNVIPLGERAWRAVLDHVLAVGDEAETTYLEVKSDVDPTTRIGVAKVAKFLLAAANRLPQQAARHFCGYAVLVIGAEQCEARGVSRGVEPHDLENSLRRYLRSQFPAFEFGRFHRSIPAVKPRPLDQRHPRCSASATDRPRSLTASRANAGPVRGSG